MVIRKARTEDAQTLAALAERTFRDTFEPDNERANMDAYCATAYSPTIQESQIRDPEMDTIIVEIDGVAAAYAQLRQGSSPNVSGPAPIELWRFYVDRAYHGRGVAAALLDAALDAARDRGARTMWLGVWEHNHRAQAFYRKVGFVEVGSHAFALGTDVQTDRIMMRAV